MNKLTFKQWLNMTDEQRITIQKHWQTYNNEGKEIVSEVIRHLKREVRHLKNLIISDDPGVYHGGNWVISVQHPFLFDVRRIPQRYLGIEVRRTVPDKDLPHQFRIQNSETEYVWAPERFEKFVDQNIDRIRRELENPQMSRSEILDALLGSDFQKHVESCREAERKGLLPKYKV